MVYNPVYETQDDDVTSAENEYNIVDEKMNGNHNLEPLSTNYASINDKVFSRKSNPSYYSVEDGKVKIPTEALFDQEMVDKNDSYETVGMKAVGSESKTKSDDSESSEITNTMKGTSPLYSEVKKDGNGAVPQIKGDLTHQNEVLATKLTDETFYGKINKNKEDANSKLVDEASIKEENGYSEVQDSIKRKTQLYSEVAPDEEGPTPRGKESVTRGSNIQTKTVPAYLYMDKLTRINRKLRTRMAKQ
ncbi:hypothetical protein BSL78_02574 [Apostichopus japonicus]|uniref:Uncharacterized protein n=1 Tax=Stichopus japonicus TaxID=307972 RepID=A0A2G8LJQ8_STIJA|nr:hypothetical protein BSL78_02574 [Apostichopus japonicus]